MTAKHQEQPASSTTPKPRVYHWLVKSSETTLCGKLMPARGKQLYNSAAAHERVVCGLCETLRHMRRDLNW